MSKTVAPAKRAALQVFFLGLLALVIVLASGKAKPVDLLLPGRDGPSHVLITRDFPNVNYRNKVGYDGQQYYAVARYFPHLKQTAPFLDYPRYRLGRILQPAIASLGGEGNNVIYLFTLLGLLGCVLATWGFVDLATRFERGPLLGYSIAVILAPLVVISAVEPLAYGLAIAGIALLERHRSAVATLLFALAVLTRETAWCFVLMAIGAYLYRNRSWRAALRATTVSIVSVLPYLAWLAYVRSAITNSALPSSGELFGLLKADTSLGTVALCLGGGCILAAYFWRDALPIAVLTVVSGLWMAILAPTTADWISLPRVWAPTIAVLIATLLEPIHRLFAQWRTTFASQAEL